MKISPLKILNFASFLQYQRFVMPISFLFYLHNGLNFSDFILFQSIFNITCLLAKIPMGVLGDLFSKKILLILSYFLFLLRVVLWIFFSGFKTVLFGEILYGLFKALWRGNVDSYIYEWLKIQGSEKKMLSGYGSLSFYTSLGSAVGCFAGVILYKFYGFKILLKLELVMQIIAFIALFMLPNIKSAGRTQCGVIVPLYKSIMSLVKNSNVNFYVYYSALLTGLTGIFVWNFQPLLKASGVPLVFYGVINFINQFLRGIGGLTASKVINKLGERNLFKVEYMCVPVSFVLLLFAVWAKNPFSSVLTAIIISFAILFFVVFNIFSVAKIHENTPNYKRAMTSSTNTFFGDFASFVLLLGFKFLYDYFGLSNALLIYAVIFSILLLSMSKRAQYPTETAD